MARVLCLTSSFPSTPDDGVCGYIADLAAGLARRHGHDVRVVAPAASGTTDDAGFSPVEVVRFRHPWPGRRRFAADSDSGAAFAGSRTGRLEAASFELAFSRAAQAHAGWADVVVSHWLVPSGLAGARMHSVALPHIAVAHGGDVQLLASGRSGRTLARWILDRADRVLCAARWQVEALGALAGPRAPVPRLVRMGADIGSRPDAADVARFRQALELGDEPGVLFLGRLVAIKGVDVLLDAAAAAPGVAIWIAGDGPEAERLRERAGAARLRVSFLGRLGRRERRLALEACEAVVIPSIVDPSGRVEGAPVVASEALVAGRPVIATRTGELPEMLADGRNALLVAPGDAADLARALTTFAGNSVLKEELTGEAVGSGPAFSMDRTVDEFASVIVELAADRAEAVAGR